jgi:hypothetical protein
MAASFPLRARHLVTVAMMCALAASAAAKDIVVGGAVGWGLGARRAGACAAARAVLRSLLSRATDQRSHFLNFWFCCRALPA